ncbi:MAG: NACHT domain-containing protein, partial [Bacteroidota bacterium]
MPLLPLLFLDQLFENQSLIAGILLALVGLISVYFFHRMGGTSLQRILMNQGLRQRLQEQLPEHLRSYRKDLEEQTLRKGHDWLGSKHTFHHILVPVHVVPSRSSSQRQSLQEFLLQNFADNATPRLLLIGEAGSGKSIAMKVAARAVWGLNEDFKGPIKVPVFLAFSDLKNLNRDSPQQDLENKIVGSLRKYQFGGDVAMTRQFVQANLYTGHLVLIIDAYDELEKNRRQEISRFLSDFLQTNRQIPVLLSSRTAVYESELPFKAILTKTVHVAPFTPFAIRQFLTAWRFEGKKNASELFELIHGRAHLADLAQNPLMLTIIAFLYTKPKYTLPDSRVEFYDQCTRALLEEWDRAQDSERANAFKSHQKVAVLAHLAYEHIHNNETTDQDIAEDLVNAITQREMDNSGLKKEQYDEMVSEIVENANLLLFLPPNAYRFPHRTFMEYFAARHLHKKKAVDQLLDLYDVDPAKWRETLLLYCGLNEAHEDSAKLLHHLQSRFVAHPKESSALILFTALMESSTLNPVLAQEILDQAADYLKNIHPDPLVIEDLGFIAGHTKWKHAQRAKEILLEQLTTNIEVEHKQNILFALMRVKEDQEVNQAILDNLKGIDLKGFFAKLSGDRLYFIQKIIDLYPTEKEQGDIIEGLKEAGQFNLLGELLINHQERRIKDLAAFALVQMSRLEGFHRFLDTARFELLNRELKSIVEHQYKEWGWPWDNPETENGKKMAVLICYLVGQSKELTEKLKTKVDEFRAIKEKKLDTADGKEETETIQKPF